MKRLSNLIYLVGNISKSFAFVFVAGRSFGGKTIGKSFDVCNNTNFESGENAFNTFWVLKGKEMDEVRKRKQKIRKTRESNAGL